MVWTYEMVRCKVNQLVWSLFGWSQTNLTFCYDKSMLSRAESQLVRSIFMDFYRSYFKFSSILVQFWPKLGQFLDQSWLCHTVRTAKHSIDCTIGYFIDKRGVINTSVCREIVKHKSYFHAWSWTDRPVLNAQCRSNRLLNVPAC